MKEVIRYVSEDGSEFDTKEECLAMDELIREINKAMSSLVTLDVGVSFLNGDGYIQQDVERYHKTWNALCEVTDDYFRDILKRPLGYDIPFMSTKFIDECSPKALRCAWRRFERIDPRTFREYGQLYFKNHPETAKGTCLNP